MLTLIRTATFRRLHKRWATENIKGEDILTDMPNSKRGRITPDTRDGYTSSNKFKGFGFIKDLQIQESIFVIFYTASFAIKRLHYDTKARTNQSQRLINY